ncbi:hypothetical protein TWF569_004453 [Orbilia oligospora]|uniref:Uncharacterized protein n=1 Tax=Orbilia oligospora TaxID=2813651 RepID=A0A7C8NQL8_ORBOL|nr:hypothetical protein TWF102_003427 [Orbilia oligospora]KAF3104719.1 hypothetical protein TWF706_004500 [Orbilia oligospora]KAF3115415.1 hypothetical protein TWF103_010840 [Orbilia oligospora]KAF3119068.1 hypothetical protein TWF569_004453 [Orbilia oligospora]KAF3131009.1 hypothetical protein TWF703_008003 [Orbilia oligospora]
MDPHLAQVLKALQETTSDSQPQNHQLSQQSYDPRRIYQPDIPLPQPVQAPQAYIQHASPPLPVSERVDPRTITQWPAALKYITTVITTNPAAMERLKKMKLHQKDHEKQWWRSREVILQRHSKNSDNRVAMDSVLKSFGVSTSSAELTPEAKLQELQTYDEKVYRASVQMYASMAEDLKSLGIPFFVITEEEFPGDKDSFLEARKKVVELIDDLT